MDNENLFDAFNDEDEEVIKHQTNDKFIGRKHNNKKEIPAPLKKYKKQKLRYSSK